MSLPEFAQLEEDNERLRDQLVDLETEKDERSPPSRPRSTS
jgi:hypothetical protein